MTPAEYVAEQLSILRREFFSEQGEKRFYQERPTLIRAITWPARWMNDSGAKLPAALCTSVDGKVQSEADTSFYAC